VDREEEERKRKKEEEGKKEEDKAESSVHHKNELFQSALIVLWKRKTYANRAWEGVEVMEGRKGGCYQTSITNQLQFVTHL